MQYRKVLLVVCKNNVMSSTIGGKFLAGCRIIEKSSFKNLLFKKFFSPKIYHFQNYNNTFTFRVRILLPKFANIFQKTILYPKMVWTKILKYTVPVCVCNQ